MPDSEATRQLAAAVDRLTANREELVDVLRAWEAVAAELTRQIATDRAEYDRRIAEASARTEAVAEASAPRAEVAAQTRGTRRRILAALVVVLVLLAAGATVLVRARDQAATARQFDVLAQERAANCVTSSTRTRAQVDMVRAQLDADRASLGLLTGPEVRPETAAFAHTVFDGRIAAAEKFIEDYPDAPLTCTVPGR